MTFRSLMHRAPLLGLVVAWAFGSALAHSAKLAVPAPALAILSLAGLLLAWTSAFLAKRANPRVATVVLGGGLFLALASVGALRTGQERARPPAWDALSLPPREARLDLRIERLFASHHPGQAFGLARVVAAPPLLADLTGQHIQFSTTWPAGLPPPIRDTRFSAVGIVAPIPFSPDPTSFDRFLADDGVNFVLSRAHLDGTIQPAGAWPRFCAASSRRLERILRAGLGENPRLADLYVAMLLGQKQALSLEQKDWFVRSGTMHLFAISGLHIVAIAAALNALLSLIRLPDRAKFIVGTLLLWLYVEITGRDASALRSFWMITCLLGARQLRAPANSLSALAASALGILVLSPHQLFSAGFQMSYAIVAALLLYGVPLQEKWHEAWRPWANLPPEARNWRQRFVDSAGRWLLAALALGLAATLVSTPATLDFFGLLSPGGFFVNLVLIPVSSLVLFAGVASLLVGLAGLSPLAVLFNHAAALVLAGMEAGVAASLRVPGMSWAARFDPPWLAPVATVGLLALLAVGYALRWPKRAGGFWTPYALLGLLLIFGVSATVPAPASASGAGSVSSDAKNPAANATGSKTASAKRSERPSH